MLPPPVDPPLFDPAADPAGDDLLSPPPLLPHAASRGAAVASPATPAIPFSIERRLGGAGAVDTAGVEGVDSGSRMAASIAAQTVSHEIHHEQSQQSLAPGECQPSRSHI